jgi:hypothetical protein
VFWNDAVPVFRVPLFRCSGVPGFTNSRHEPVNAVGLPNVKGGLKSHLAFWTDIKAPDFIIDCIREGYKIPFYSTLEPATFPNNRSAHVHADFVSEALSELLSTCRIVETPA